MKYYDISINRTEHYRVKAKDFNEAISKTEAKTPWCVESYGHNGTERTIDSIKIEEYD
jgi:hypothetical protein